MDGFWTAYGAHSYVPHFSRNASTGTYLRNVITGFEIMKACEQSSGCLAALASQFHKAVAAALSPQWHLLRTPPVDRITRAVRTGAIKTKAQPPQCTCPMGRKGGAPSCSCEIESHLPAKSKAQNSEVYGQAKHIEMCPSASTDAKSNPHFLEVLLVRPASSCRAGTHTKIGGRCASCRQRGTAEPTPLPPSDGLPKTCCAPNTAASSRLCGQRQYGIVWQIQQSTRQAAQAAGALGAFRF
jgi:hypothetical protein